MLKPRTTQDAEDMVADLKDRLDFSKRQLVDTIHRLVIRMFGTSTSRLFGVAGFSSDDNARGALVLLLHKHPQLQLDRRWIAEFLSCEVRHIDLYVRATQEVLRDNIGGDFEKRFESICRHVGIQIPAFLA